MKPRVSISCEDALVREGLRSLLEPSVRSSAGAGLHVGDSSNIVLPESLLVVFPDAGVKADRLACLQALPLEWTTSSALLGVAVCRLPIDQLVVLRLAESGIGYVVAYDDVVRRPSVLMELLDGDTTQYRLPTPWAIRERLGLRWDGDMRAFCDLIADLPSGAWIEEWKQSRLPISRRQIAKVRTQARDVAGLPAPPAYHYSTTHRASPDVPVWSEVREMVLRLWGLKLEDRWYPGAR